MNSQFLSPDSWKDYQLIDCGDTEKLERFGEYILIRPEPQALWPKVLKDNEWIKMAHARFDREQKEKYRFSDEAKGGWKKLKSMPDSWNVTYQYNNLNLNLRLALTSFGHVGVFPEQGTNWNFIYDTVSQWKGGKVLNLFAYTGAASVVSKIAGADVTHVDASRPGLNWANQNMQLNDQNNIRWVYEDALKFVKREVKRNNTYNGIIMDPPPYGRGPDGEKWTLEEKLNELIEMSSSLLKGEQKFFILNMYAVGLSPLVGYNLIKTHFKTEADNGEFFLKSENGRDLPMGTFCRFNQ